MLALAGSYLFLDRPVAYAAERIPVRLNPLFHRISDLSGVWPVTVAVLVMVAVFVFRAWARGKPRRPMVPLLYIPVSALTASLTCELLKIVFARYRPALLIDAGLHGFSFWKAGYWHNSFPSGHATVAFAFFGALAFSRPQWRTGAFLVAGLVAVSRVLLNLHYLSDVLVGALLGLGIALLYRRVLTRFGYPVNLQEANND